jgi:hypothetical protein
MARGTPGGAQDQQRALQGAESHGGRLLHDEGVAGIGGGKCGTVRLLRKRRSATGRSSNTALPWRYEFHLEHLARVPFLQLPEVKEHRARVPRPAAEREASIGRVRRSRLVGFRTDCVGELIVAYKDPQRQKAYAREWLKRYPEKAREAAKRWNRAHPEARLAQHRKDRAKRSRVPGSFTLAEWRALVIAYAGRCGYCGASAPLHADHRIPL